MFRDEVPQEILETLGPLEMVGPAAAAAQEVPGATQELETLARADPAVAAVAVVLDPGVVRAPAAKREHQLHQVLAAAAVVAVKMAEEAGEGLETTEVLEAQTQEALAVMANQDLEDKQETQEAQEVLVRQAQVLMQ
jgi:hypothetical protein